MSAAPAPTPARPLPDAADKPRAVEAMFDRIASRYDLLNRVLTFGLDVSWRRRTVASLGLPTGSRVLDVACGTGDLCRELTRAGLRAAGVDFSAGMLRAARTTAPLVRGDALRMPFPDDAFDGVTCGFALRNFAALEPVLDEMARVVRPGGRLALLDVAEPAGGLALAVHRTWFRRVVPFVGGLVSDRTAYAYLPASTAYLPPPAALVSAVGAHGFEHVAHTTLGLGAAQLVTGTRAP
ncbi:MAG: demethylmenaquinone methyltransferase [Acidimicrobiia bacterium]|nr:MAG: demethylmenaquinone methyltransferase [Acidimicrobiia bacterium]